MDRSFQIRGRVEALKRAVGVRCVDSMMLLSHLTDAEARELGAILERHFPENIPELSCDWLRVAALIRQAEGRQI